MKILAYGDLHIHNFPEFSFLNELGYSNRVELAIKSLRYVLDFAVDHGITHVINLGDLVEQSKVINTVIADLLAQVLSDVKYKDLTHDIIVGNHDQVDKHQVYNVPHVYKNYFNNVISINNSDKFYTTNKNYNVLYLPYMEDYSSVVDIVKSISIEDRKKTYVFGHWSVDGVKYSEDYPAEATVKQLFFDGFALVVMGHIHLRQNLGTNIVYPGSLLAHSYKDSIGDKGFVVVDTLSGDHTLYNNPFTPIFHTMEVNSLNDFDLVKVSDVDFYRLKINYNEIYKYKDKIESMNNVSVIPQTNQLASEVRMQVSENDTEADLVSNYVLSQGSFSKTLSKYGEEVLKIAGRSL